MAFPDGIADFRSDTVTRPTDEMRKAMAEAEVGDDVYSDDPTANALEEEAAAVVGKEAAVFVPTGTMGNQLAIMLQTRPGDEVLSDPGIHSRNVERGAASALSGVCISHRRRPRRADHSRSDRSGDVDRRLLPPHPADGLGEHPQPVRWAGHPDRRDGKRLT